MTFQQLQYLLEVNKTGSFTQAAANLFVTQSCISSAVASLEQELGTQIFQRSRKTLSPTEEGAHIIARANDILINMHLMKDKQLPRKSSVRISTIGYQPVLDAYMRLLQENKGRTDVAFSLEHGSGDPQFQRLRYFDLEIFVMYVFSSMTSVIAKAVESHRLHHEILDTIPAAFCIGPKHKLYDKEDVTFKDFESEIILDNSLRSVSNSEPPAAYLYIDPKNVITAEFINLRQKIVREGLAYEIGPMPPRQIREGNGLRYIPIPNLSYNVLAITNPHHPGSAEYTRFWEFLRESITAYKKLDEAPLSSNNAED